MKYLVIFSLLVGGAYLYLNNQLLIDSIEEQKSPLIDDSNTPKTEPNRQKNTDSKTKPNQNTDNLDTSTKSAVEPSTKEPSNIKSLASEKPLRENSSLLTKYSTILDQSLFPDIVTKYESFEYLKATKEDSKNRIKGFEGKYEGYFFNEIKENEHNTLGHINISLEYKEPDYSTFPKGAPQNSTELPAYWGKLSIDFELNTEPHKMMYKSDIGPWLEFRTSGDSKIIYSKYSSSNDPNPTIFQFIIVDSDHIIGNVFRISPKKKRQTRIAKFVLNKI